MKKTLSIALTLVAVMTAASAAAAGNGGGLGAGFPMQRIEQQQKDMSNPNAIDHRPFGSNCPPADLPKQTDSTKQVEKDKVAANKAKAATE